MVWCNKDVPQIYFRFLNENFSNDLDITLIWTYFTFYGLPIVAENSFEL